MAGQLGGQPIFILREGSQRTKGREAQNNNIMAAKAVAAAVRTTLGPKGMDKMLVDSMGDIVITNDGATILKEMDIEHPAAKMIVEVAKTQDDEVGDGTTTAAVLAGEFLKNAEELLEMGVHPTVIASGYRLASIKAKEILQTLAKKVTSDDKDLLLKIAATAITGKGAEASKDVFANLTVNAILAVVDIENGKKVVDVDDIKVEKKVGGSVEDSQLIEGMVIDKERVHTNMPKKITDARILLINEALEIKKTEVDAEISIKSPDQLQLFLDQEEQMIHDMVTKVINSGANVLFVQKGIDDIAQHYLAKAGIYAARRVKKSDMDKLARATGAKILTSLKEITDSDLGKAGLVEEKKIGDEAMTYVTECHNPKAVSIILRGGTEHVADEAERALHDALRVVGVAIEDETLVAGGGSPEIELALRLREYASTLKGREQLAVAKFAEALEVIPRTLAENAGLDPINMLVEMRSQHEKGNKTAGLNVFTGKVVDMWKEGVVEPLRVKTQAISSGTEAATMILRIDDVLSSKSAPGGGMPPGGMGGMGDMGGMGGMD
ncbi:MAG: thermosome subunit [Candidatus Methanoperedens nitroreducens]|uniref:Thermosome subunit n=1 Tax=Candidatus Methanoperedens nitratireducens TaxID=1392998 RepID=A0A0P8AA73_9EURY|nr:thermosome subunit beta [Candidatus Methanoperedens sp. BLZ2]KAB2946777.1 MAG: thermosome subunit [Candidatus Methanoperedens sp.]KPQ43531.1 MAG: thermosome subunit [Candidatus Methanoperedens sp. BLZ1]MBZ0175801.1 TCP-1/cpn60 chaperonin family protein [Candidatus Methanoperedens nitroreducens]MCX9079259.1 thermosome subunit beta [Candidatus Methanoperedens sp.]MCX9087881.1 thermosome subunit beta [Candidatus Methanoperedens sp.]